jgi:hypothetical protein
MAKKKWSPMIAFLFERLFAVPKKIRFPPASEERFCRGCRAKRESAITYEFSALGGCAEKRMSFCLSARHTYGSFDGVS